MHSSDKTKRNLKVKALFRLRSKYRNLKQGLRIYCLKSLGAHIGKNVKLGSVKVIIPEQVAIGDHCEIEDDVRLRIGGPWKQSTITIDEETFIGHSTQINVGSRFYIGKKCLIAPLCIFSDAHHTFTDLNTPIHKQRCIYTPITIEDNVWIGTSCIILGGVTIHSGAVIAAGAVVTRSVPANEVWAGVPAKKIKSRI
jgi:acetyltransferase-like isoleucine patch superfamily enzyme